MVPEGWEKRRLSELADVTSGGTPSRSKPEYWNGTIPWVTTAEIYKRTITDTAEKLTIEGLENSSAKLFPPGSILLAMYGQGRTRGQVAILGIQAATNQACAAILPRQHVSGDYLYQNLLSRYEEIRGLANDGSQKNLSGELIKSISILEPPLDEQQKIATILGTWDRAIRTIDALVDNCQRQRQVLLNGLLTGQARLRQFGSAIHGSDIPKGWKTILLGNLGRCITGLTYSPEDVVDQGGLLVLRSSNISDNEISLDDNVYVSSQVPEESRTRIGDILVAVRNGSRNLIGKNAVIDARSSGMAHGAFMTLYRSDENYYISHLFQSDMFFQQVGRNLGATINSINISHLNKFKFPFPPKEERSAIASALSAASREITALRDYLAIVRLEKEALMQQLLTGKRRVVITNPSETVAVNK